LIFYKFVKFYETGITQQCRNYHLHPGFKISNNEIKKLKPVDIENLFDCSIMTVAFCSWIRRVVSEMKFEVFRLQSGDKFLLAFTGNHSLFEAKAILLVS
jgi:hypothetical protein